MQPFHLDTPLLLRSQSGAAVILQIWFEGYSRALLPNVLSV